MEDLENDLIDEYVDNETYYTITEIDDNGRKYFVIKPKSGLS